MNQKETTPIIYASEARVIAQGAQATNFEKAMQQIKTAAEQGFEEVTLFSLWLDMDTVKRLMDMGYSLTTFLHPFEQRKMYKVTF